MPRGKSNRGNSRGSDGRSNSRSGGRRNISSSRGFGAMEDETQRRISAKGGRASHGGRGRNSNS